MAKLVCPHICEDTVTERRSKMFNSLHKNLQRLATVGKYLMLYDIPSFTQSLPTLRRKHQKERKAFNAAGQDGDTDSDVEVHEVPQVRKVENVGEIPDVHTVERVVEVP